MATSLKYAGTGAGWTDSGNIISDNGLYASYLGGVGVWPALVATNFLYAIPGDATIDGFEPAIERHYEIGAVIDNSIKLVKAGVAVGNDIDTGASWPAADAVVTLGGATEKGGQSWTPADVNASNCGVSIVAEGTGVDAEGYIDFVRMTVYFTEAPASTVQVISIMCLNAVSLARAGLALCAGNRARTAELLEQCRARLSRKRSQTCYGIIARA